MNLIIKAATEQSIDDILEMLYELGRPRPDGNIDGFRDIIEQYIIDQDKMILVAIHDDRIVGMISIMFLSRLNRITKEMYIPELIVTHDLRSCGIGTRLVNECISLARQYGCHRIRLETGNQRQRSHQFYKRLGFKQTSLSFVFDMQLSWH